MTKKRSVDGVGFPYGTLRDLGGHPHKKYNGEVRSGV